MVLPICRKHTTSEIVRNREILRQSSGVDPLDDEVLGLGFVEGEVLFTNQKEAGAVGVEVDLRNVGLVVEVEKHQMVLVVLLGLPEEVQLGIVPFHDDDVVLYGGDGQGYLQQLKLSVDHLISPKGDRTMVVKTKGAADDFIQGDVVVLGERLQIKDADVTYAGFIIDIALTGLTDDFGCLRGRQVVRDAESLQIFPQKQSGHFVGVDAIHIVKFPLFSVMKPLYHVCGQARIIVDNIVRKQPLTAT